MAMAGSIHTIAAGTTALIYQLIIFFIKIIKSTKLFNNQIHPTY